MRRIGCIEELRAAVAEAGTPCVVKPLMSSSGKGQSTVKSEEDIERAWSYSQSGKRGDIAEVIVESFVNFHTEITLLTVTQKNGTTLFCPPIGHRQERGDYQESWQPCFIGDEQLQEAQEIADKVTRSLTGAGIWGVEFFLADDGIYFSELSPRPHDTGMVTLAGTQNLSEFELHARAVLGLPIPEITLLQVGASAVVLADTAGKNPQYIGVEEALKEPHTDIRIFGKPTTRPYRRMAVALASDQLGSDVNVVKEKAIANAKKVRVVSE